MRIIFFVRGNMDWERSKLLLAFTFMISIVSSAFAEKETGSISGHVADTEGTSIPGVMISASNKTLTGYNSETYTDQAGSYRFTSLHPGEYEIKAELQGFQTVVRKDVRLFVGQTVVVEFRLEIQPVAATIEILGQTPAFDATSPSSSKTVPTEEVQNLPKFSSSVDLFTLSPGVGDLDRVAYGSTPQGNAFWVDGVDLSHPFSGVDFVSPNYNWIEEVQVVGIGAPAEYGGFTGVIANSVTKSGSNQFHGLLETFFQNDSFTSNNLNNPAFTPANLDLFIDTTVQLGGPIVRDKLWFFSGFQYFYKREAPLGYPPGGGEAFVTDTHPKILNKLTYKANDNNTLQGFIEWDDGDTSGSGANAFRLPEATSFRDRTQLYWNLGWTSFLKSGSSLDIRTNGFSGERTNRGRDPNLPGHGDVFTGISSQNFCCRIGNDIGRNQIHALFSHYADDFILGNHDFRFGVQYERSRGDLGTYFNGNIYYYDYNGAPYLRFITEGYRSESLTNSVAAFAQDNWLVTDQLTLSLGVRWDHNRVKLLTNPAEFGPTNGIAPRLGIVYDWNGDEKTILKIHYGHYFDSVISGTIIGVGDSADTFVELFNQATNQWELIAVQHGASLWTIDDDIKQPYSQQFTAGMDKILPGEINLSAHYIYKSDRNVIEDFDVVGIYEPVPFLNPLTGETITVFNLLNPEEGVSFFITNPSNLFRKYHGLELYGSKRFSDKFYLAGSVVLSRIRGNVDNDLFTGTGISPFLDSPNDQINNEGRLQNDVSTEIKLHGYYYFPWGINTGFYFRHFSGDTWTPLVRVTGLNQGPFFIFGLPRGSERLPGRNVFDLRLEKMFSIYDGQLRFTLDMFNVFNTGYPLAVENRFGRGNYGATTAFSAPREMRLGIRYTF